MTLLKGLQHAQACLSETRCSDRDGHALAVEALAAAIAAAESAPAVVTKAEIAEIVADCFGHETDHDQDIGICVAALVAERTAAAVEAALAEEREALSVLIREQRDTWPAGSEAYCACQSVLAGLAIRARGEAPPAQAEGAVTLHLGMTLGRGTVTEFLDEPNTGLALLRERESGRVFDLPVWLLALAAQGEAPPAQAPRTRDALVRALRDAAEDMIGMDCRRGAEWKPEHDRLRAALDALGKEGA